MDRQLSAEHHRVGQTPWRISHRRCFPHGFEHGGPSAALFELIANSGSQQLLKQLCDLAPTGLA